MSKGLKLAVQLQINAPLALVWEALTAPEIVKQYFFGTQLDTTWQVGSPIFFRGEWEGAAYEDKGTVLEYEQMRRIRYDYLSSFSGLEDVPENYANIGYEVQEQDGKCLLTITQDGFENEEKRAHSEQSWLSIMGQMRDLVEQKQADIG